MLDRFDLLLLNLVQRDDSRTADELSTLVPLSPSAIARRLRRLRRESWISHTIALLSPKLRERRLRAVVLVQLAEHADRPAIAALIDRLLATDEVQLAYEISGTHDFMVLLDCASMDAFVSLADELFATSPTVRRYETSFVKRELKFAPFVQLSRRDSIE